MPALPTAGDIALLVAAINTVGVVLVLGYGIRAFLRRDLITKAELEEREIIHEAERKRVEADSQAWQTVAQKATENANRVTDQFEAALDALRDRR